MIHKPSLVACSPFGAGPGDLKAISTLPAERVLIAPRFGAALNAGAKPTTGAAAPIAKKFLRPIIEFLLTRVLIQPPLPGISCFDLPAKGSIHQSAGVGDRGPLA